MEDKIYTLAEMRNLRIFTGEYQFNMTEAGEFDATLDLKAQTKRGDLRCFFTLVDGRKFIATTHWFQHHLGIREVPIGTRLKLTYSRTNSGAVYLTAVKILGGW